MTTQFKKNIFSPLVLNQQIMPNPVEEYEPAEYEVVTKQGVEVVAKPSELPANYALNSTIRQHIKDSGAFSIVPFSFNWNQHSQIYTVIKEMKKFSDSIGISTCRVDAIARDPGLAEMICDMSGTNNITIAVEGISERIRNFLQKSLTDEDFYVGLDNIVKAGFTVLKIYYIFTGLENEEDLKEYEKLLSHLAGLKKSGNKSLKVRISFTPLLSSIGTALQYHGSQIYAATRAQNSILKRIQYTTGNYSFDFRMSTSYVASEYQQIQEFLDRRHQYLLEYHSLVTLYDNPKIALLFFNNGKEIKESAYKKLPKERRIKVRDKFYECTEPSRISDSRLYQYILESSLYPHCTFKELLDYLKGWEGKEVDQTLIDFFNGVKRFEEMRGFRIAVSEGNPPFLLHTYENGRQQHYSFYNVNFDLPSLERFKELLPIFANGFTYKDVVRDKQLSAVLQGTHVKFHEGQHQGALARQYVENSLGVFGTYCIADMMDQCLTCGLCSSKQEMQHITNTHHELGYRHYPEVKATNKDTELRSKLIIEVQTGTGPYSAIRPQFLKLMVNRAVLQATEGELVEVLNGNKTASSRAYYKIKAPNFKDLVSGSQIFTMPFSITKEKLEPYLEKIAEAFNKSLTKGWEGIRLQILDQAQSISKSTAFQLVTFIFDSRKIKGYDLNFLRTQSERYNRPSATLWYKRHVVLGRDLVKAIAEPFDKSRVLSIHAGFGKTAYETKLTVLMETQEVHPMIWLAGFLGMNERGTGNPKTYQTLGSVQIWVDGFYSKLKNQEQGNSLLTLVGSDTKGNCPNCGGSNLLVNIFNSNERTYHELSNATSKRAKAPNTICPDCIGNLELGETTIGKFRV